MLLYKTKVIESITFDSGKNVDKSENFVGLDGNINISFKEMFQKYPQIILNFTAGAVHR